MISISNSISNMLGQPARQIKARVELYENSTLQDGDYNLTLLNIFSSSNALKEFKIERTGENGRFFGFGICHKLTLTLLDKDREINITKGQVIEIAYSVAEELTYPYPLFLVEEVSRDENNNDLTITAYDFLYKAREHSISELNLSSYTIRSFIEACAALLNLPLKFETDEEVFDLFFQEGGNFNNTETLREGLDAAADATQTIFFVDYDKKLTFKRLDHLAEPVLHIDKSRYFELTDKSARTLTTLCHATELGDNLIVSTGEPGETQYIRNNAFWDLREDRDTLLNNALAAVAGITINQFDCSWRGNFALQVGDKISIETKDSGALVGYVLNDTLTYNGGLKEQTSWEYTESEGETAANPTNLGEALKQTFAKVDKINKEITLYASEISDTKSNIGEIQVTTQQINASVSSMEQRVSDMEEDTNDKLDQIYNDVSLKMDKEGVEIVVEEKMVEGVNKVITSGKKYSFDDEGLNISSSLNSVSTSITEDGMTINRGGKDVLVANNEGVYAEDLHATTYLIIGNTSRLEDYNNRTTCYWIGG